MLAGGVGGGSLDAGDALGGGLGGGTGEYVKDVVGGGTEGDIAAGFFGGLTGSITGALLTGATRTMVLGLPGVACGTALGTLAASLCDSPETEVGSTCDQP